MGIICRIRIYKPGRLISVGWNGIGENWWFVLFQLITLGIGLGGFGTAIGSATSHVYADTEIPFQNPFGEQGGTKAAIISSVEIVSIAAEGEGDPKEREESQPKVRVRIREGEDWELAAGDYDFFEVMEGNNMDYEDTDSAQFAVKWMEGEKESGHYTNATRRRGGADQKREKGAVWTIGNKEPKKREVYRDVPIPEKADQVQIVIVYTDMLMNTNAHRFRGEDPDGNKSQGDIPGVIGSWRGGRTPDGKWNFQKNANDIFPHQADFPTMAQIRTLTTQAINVVKNNTGYILEERPSRLKGKTTEAKIRAAIAEALELKEINSDHDTGFDILLR